MDNNIDNNKTMLILVAKTWLNHAFILTCQELSVLAAIHPVKPSTVSIGATYLEVDRGAIDVAYLGR